MRKRATHKTPHHPKSRGCPILTKLGFLERADLTEVIYAIYLATCLCSICILKKRKKKCIISVMRINY